jgi:hypothetical protein
MYDSTEPNLAHSATFRPVRTRRWAGRYSGKHRQPDELSNGERTEALLDQPRAERPGADEPPAVG